MKRQLILAIAAWIGMAGLALGQGGPRHQGRMYNPATVETITGTVIKVEQAAGKGGARSQGVHLVLKTDKEELQVLLGPASYVDKQALKIKPQDVVTVRGSRITFSGEPAVIAAEVKKGDQVLQLRDDSGTPAWRGQGRRQP